MRPVPNCEPLLPIGQFVLFAIANSAAFSRAERVLPFGWIHQHVDYIPGVSTAETPLNARSSTVQASAAISATRHHIVPRAQHPARAVSAYAWELDPPTPRCVRVFLEGAGGCGSNAPRCGRRTGPHWRWPRRG